MPLVRAVANGAVATLLLVMGLACILTAYGLYAQRQDSAAFTHCTAEWQDDFLTAYEARSEAASAVSRAMDRVVQAVSDHDATGFRKAVRHYLSVRAQQNEERAKHPLPPLPSVRCGE